MLFLWRTASKNLRTILSCKSLSGFRCLSNNSNETNTNVVKDVILFKYENPRFFKYLNLCAIVQFGFWTYLSTFSYKTLRDAPVPEKPNAAWYEKINLGDQKYRYIITVSTFLIGYGFVVVAWMYTLRSVRYLILRKGGNAVSFVTYTPLGHNRIMTVDLKYISSQEARDRAKSLLPIKIQNRLFYYLLDMRGEFRNPALFDHTAGLKRKLL